ncbi:MAG: UDP-N-acetylmuramoyl-tripeptide--D-alanyl-D-alanine ligase [Nevskiaceae bacterium]|nr:MAG: UDP-N-acetylmuramoyl-tripeptide--D-alanyl-D-alanine ligase [Nevskiaceae bacterium]TBR73424.1 MAG: UDP-N-acetylmuramoyl-tripeptide--D-alanyl-D-alanine ligase [Nevskiaceae bacterium]
MTTLADFASRTGGRLSGADAPFARVTTDTRALQPGDLYVALIGERFDGHDFAAQAQQAGAVGAVVAHAVDGVALPQVVVGDTLAALQRFAASWRAGFAIPLVGITGSVGKTTTRTLTAAVFAELGPVLANVGNLNNHIGVPLTLCRLRAEHRAAVIEMGASHQREIALLASLAKPGIGVVTLAGDAHLEGFGGRDGVAHGKGEMFTALGGRGTAVINADDHYAPLWRDMAGTSRILTFGLDVPASVTAREVELDASGCHFTLATATEEARVALQLPGRHNVRNACAAAAAGLAAGLSLAAIARRLGTPRTVAGRGVWCAGLNGAQVSDDAYNANPTSMRAALEVLARRGGRRIAVFGDMGELGPDAEALHEQVGHVARALGIDTLCGVGPLSRATVRGFGTGGQHFADQGALLAAVAPLLAPNVSVLVKGSHSAHMERVVAALTQGKN